MEASVKCASQAATRGKNAKRKQPAKFIPYPWKECCDSWHFEASLLEDDL